MTQRRSARLSALSVTKVTQVVGLAIAFNEAVLRAAARDSVIAFCALCVLGAQAAENATLKLIDRVLGDNDPSHPPDPG